MLRTSLNAFENKNKSIQNRLFHENRMYSGSIIIFFFVSTSSKQSINAIDLVYFLGHANIMIMKYIFSTKFPNSFIFAQRRFLWFFFKFKWIEYNYNGLNGLLPIVNLFIFHLYRFLFTIHILHLYELFMFISILFAS